MSNFCLLSKIAQLSTVRKIYCAFCSLFFVCTKRKPLLFFTSRSFAPLCVRACVRAYVQVCVYFLCLFISIKSWTHSSSTRKKHPVPYYTAVPLYVKSACSWNHDGQSVFIIFIQTFVFIYCTLNAQMHMGCQKMKWMKKQQKNNNNINIHEHRT